MAAKVLAIDIGSSSTRAALFDDRAVPIASSHAKREYAIRYTPDGGAELDPLVLQQAVRCCMKTAGRAEVTSACSFWHSLLGLNGRGEPVTPVFTWADSRSIADAAELRREFDEREVQLRTGCVLRAAFWPAKLRWLRRTQTRLFGRVARWVSPADWLLGSSGTTHSMASGTGLYNLHTRSWDAELCAACGIRVEQLGELCDTATIGDGAASNIGSGADREQRVAINIGTSAAVRVVENGARTPIPPGLFRYVIDGERTLLGGAISNGGNLRAWCARELQLHNERVKISRTRAAEDTLDALPFWVNERAPSWPEDVQGAITGITQSTTADDLLRVLTVSTFYRHAGILDQMQEHAGSEVIVSGGILKSPELVPILADSLGRDVRVSREQESSLRGAAVFALERFGSDVKPLPRGRLVRHSPALAAKHRERRARQQQLEYLLGHERS
jgi:gluconokinase